MLLSKGCYVVVNTVIEFILGHQTTTNQAWDKLWKKYHAEVVEAELRYCSGIEQKTNVGLIAKMLGGIENLGFIVAYCNNYLCIKWTEEMEIRNIGDNLNISKEKHNLVLYCRKLNVTSFGGNTFLSKRWSVFFRQIIIVAWLMLAINLATTI